ncbi:MAG: TlpA family protein disulfide reductase [Candidatus Eisenbacteria bacterium]|nr:TlpA family protein disulfide reductase [Candidatus Eisenbacteria bacterium]
MTKRRGVGTSGWAAVLLVAATCAFGATPTKAPDFTLPNVEGKSLTLSELLKGGPVVVDFWATWCKPCIKAFPDLQQVLDKYADCGLRVVAVSIDGPKSASRVGALIASKGHTFDVVLDTSQDVARKFHVSAVPRTVLINTKGEIVYATAGYRPQNHAELDAAVRSLLPAGCPERTKQE